jgi:PPM family protein phosphatase
MKIVSCGLTDVGMKRSGNEDSLVCADDVGLYVVADGMGGHAAGEVASNTAVSSVESYVRETLGREEEADAEDTGGGIAHDISVMEAGVQLANQTICDLSESNPEYNGMGTTFSGVLVVNSRAAFAHVGDSRIYLLRDDLLNQLTTDHSWVSEQMERKIITAEEARTHRWRNVITRALGNRRELKVDTGQLQLLPGDRLLLCSDGLTGMVEDEDLAEVLRSAADDIEGPSQRLIDMANDAGGGDNVTVVMLRVDE